MLTPPQQNWAEYEMLTQASDAEWIRQLTPEQRFYMYGDLFGILERARQGRGDWVKVDAWHWDEKLAARRRVVSLLQRLDELRAGQAPGDYAG